jgi:chromosomal replication initiator protein
MPRDAPATPALPIGAIQEAVCRRFGVTLQELVSHGRSKTLVRARHAAFLLARGAGYSFPQISAAFGDRCHATVLHGIKRAQQMRVHDLDFAAALMTLDSLAGCSKPAAPLAT